MQVDDGIVVVSVPDGSVCRCGEQMVAGERAGFDPSTEEVICLHCLADRRAGRPQVLNRPQLYRRSVRPPQVALPRPGADPWAPLTRTPGRGSPAATIAVALVVAIVVTFVGGLGAIRALDLLPGRATAAADDPNAYVFMNTDRRGEPVTWDPCLTIELVVNDAAAPAGSETLLAEAVDRVNAASGLHLKIIGPTNQVPKSAQTARDLMSGLPGASRAPVLVAWTTPEVVPGLKGSIVGLGGPVHMFASTLDRERYVGGQVDLDGPQMAGILRSHNGHARARAVVMHELAHLVGLTHVDNPRQIMVASNGTATEFAQGDLTGLAKLGSGGCPYDLTPGTPATVDLPNPPASS